MADNTKAEYEVVDADGVTRTYQLTAADAKLINAKKVEPATKQATPKNKSA